MKQTFCLQCNQVITPQLIQREETHTYRGEAFIIRANASVCPHCGEEFLTEESHDSNLQTLQAMYRSGHSLLTPDEIRGIRAQYDLSAKSFAKVLGLGEISITRYENGSVQDEAQNNLIFLMKDPSAFSLLYEKNKHRLTMKEIEKVDRILRRSRTLVVWEGTPYTPLLTGQVQYDAGICDQDHLENCFTYSIA